MTTHIVAIIALAAVCGLWVVFQRFVRARHPDIRGPEDSAGGCCSGHCGGGQGHCESHAERHPEEKLLQLPD
jgi:hypothetical protein